MQLVRHTVSNIIEEPVLGKEAPIWPRIVWPSGSVLDIGFGMTVALPSLVENFLEEGWVELPHVLAVGHPEVAREVAPTSVTSGECCAASDFLCIRPAFEAVDCALVAQNQCLERYQGKTQK